MIMLAILRRWSLSKLVKMYIKSMVIVDFKSYAQRTEVNGKRMLYGNAGSDGLKMAR